jgi:hypothetical protein
MVLAEAAMKSFPLIEKAGCFEVKYDVFDKMTIQTSFYKHFLIGHWEQQKVIFTCVGSIPIEKCFSTLWVLATASDAFVTFNDVTIDSNILSILSVWFSKAE